MLISEQEEQTINGITSPKEVAVIYTILFGNQHNDTQELSSTAATVT
jgi:hypothetical protein